MAVLYFCFFFVQNSHRCPQIINISLVTQKTQSSTNGLTCRKVDACLVFFSTPREIQLMTSYNTKRRANEKLLLLLRLLQALLTVA